MRIWMNAKELQIVNDALTKYETWVGGDFQHDSVEDYPGEFEVLARLQYKIASAKDRA